MLYTQRQGWELVENQILYIQILLFPTHVNKFEKLFYFETVQWIIRTICEYLFSDESRFLYLSL